MGAATVPPLAKPETAPKPKPEMRVLARIRIDDADWQTYEKFLTAIGDRGIRCTYDRGRLEIMAPMRIHEREKRFLGRMVEITTFELDMPLGSCGSMTIRREDLARGFEPDECYYIQHAQQMSELREPDFRVDPPPDLAIEVDVSSSSIDRHALYATLRIPELWRMDEEGDVQILHLQPNQLFVAADRSLSFPFLTRDIVNQFLRQFLASGDETGTLRAFHRWLLTNARPAPPGPVPPASNGP